jgi:hypothetical protein
VSAICVAVSTWTWAAVSACARLVLVSRAISVEPVVVSPLAATLSLVVTTPSVSEESSGGRTRSVGVASAISVEAVSVVDPVSVVDVAVSPVIA